MSGGLLTVVLAYLLLVALLAGATALGAPLSSAVRTGLVVGQVLLVVQAAIDVATLVTGHRPAELAIHLGYAIASVVLLPLVAGMRRQPPAGRADQVLAAFAAVVSAVVSLRLHATWQA